MAKIPQADEQPEQLALAEVKPVLREEAKALTDVSRVGNQLGNGGFKTFQTGQKFKVFQELHCTPSRKTLKLIVLTKKPSSVPTPEPLCAREILSHFLMFCQG